MRKQVKNLKAFIGIEPTTREIILHPQKKEKYPKQEIISNS